MARSASKPRPSKPRNPKSVRDPLAALSAVIRGTDKSGLIDVLRLSDDDVWSNVRRYCSTRSIAIDTALGGHGLPYGRVAEVFGKPQVGKTTLRDQLFAECQRQGGVGVLTDSEEKTDKGYSEKLGVRIKDILIAQPGTRTIESALLTLDRVLDWALTTTAVQQVPVIYAWDTLAGTPTELELTKGVQVGAAARSMRFGMRTMVSRIARVGLLWLINNQEYQQIGAFSPVPGRIKKTTYGGDGVHYHATTRIELVRTETLRGPGNAPLGMIGLCRVYKNSLGIPRDEQYAIQWGKGFCNAWSIFTKLREHSYITPAGAYWKFGMQGHPEVTWQGNWYGLQDLLDQNPDLFKFMAAAYTQLPAYVKKVF